MPYKKGTDIYRNQNLLAAAAAVKATAGKIYGYEIFNDDATPISVKFYNKAAADVTVGTDTPLFSTIVLADRTRTRSFSRPVDFSTALSVACTTELEDTGTTAPGANECKIHIEYE